MDTSDNQMHPWKAILIVLALVAIAIGGLWIISQFIKSDIALGAIGFAGAIATASIQYRAAKDKEVNGRLFTEKQKVYSELITLILSMFSKGSPLVDGPPPDELVEQLKSIRTKLIIWGSFDTVNALDRMGEAGIESTETENPASGLKWLAILMSNMRKDLGHKDPKNAGEELAVGMIIPRERAQIRAALRSLEKK